MGEDNATKKRRSDFNTSTFKKHVLERYNALLEDDAWCHVLGEWFPKKNVKVARLVPKSFESSELSYLFGVGEMPEMDPKNGEFQSAIPEIIGSDFNLIQQGCRSMPKSRRPWTGAISPLSPFHQRPVMESVNGSA